MLWKLMYVVMCVAVPMGWGVLVYLVSDRVDRWLARRDGKRDATTEIEYQI